ncbi:glycosyltransferase family 39 protein [Nevskia soli]|uniref:glycosyltransferase family 39 protein n=1 Tax=Nevskia soli TaxID=418856 RepID=UPI0015D71FFF|nr:glycosyltransferase family 39 protein [Nevskia soli]
MPLPSARSKRVQVLLPLVLACAVFLTLAILLIPLPGIQNDEVIFANPLYQPSVPFLSIGSHRHYVQVMIISYLGALKTLLYLPLLRLFHPSVWVLRLPPVFLCIGAIALTWLYTRRVAGLAAAAIAAVLLAADPAFLLTGTLDWGPVALQHFLLMAGWVSLLRWFDSGREMWLAVAFFAWGLGLWDKALFIWPLSGLVIAALCVYPRQVLARVRARAAGIALAALFMGAFPLIAYNVTHRGATVDQNSHFVLDETALKVNALRETLDGVILFDMLVPNTASAAPFTPSSAWQRGSLWLTHKAGDRHRTGFEWWLLAAIVPGLLIVSRRERRQMLFLLVAMAVAFLQMLITKGAGASAHHEILLWPFPAILFAIPFGALAGGRFRALRWGSLAIVGGLFAQELLTVNQYVAGFLANGFSPTWSDAIYPLARTVQARPGTRFEIVDWGYLNSLVFLTAGKVNVDNLSECLVKSASPADSDCGFAALARVPGIQWIQYTPVNEAFPQVDEHLERIAGAGGYREVIDQVVTDSHARPIFQVFHFEKQIY